jgi:hypothetical protein
VDRERRGELEVDPGDEAGRRVILINLAWVRVGTPG